MLAALYFSAVHCSRRRRQAAAPAASPGTTGMGSASSSPYSGLAGADSGYSAGLESEDQRIVDRCACLAFACFNKPGKVRTVI